jgi:hypothetical protein
MAAAIRAMGGGVCSNLLQSERIRLSRSIADALLLANSEGVRVGAGMTAAMRCPMHGDQVHGREAEQLRKGIEEILARPHQRDGAPSVDRQLQALLDRVDARDSLAYLERQGRR